MRSQESLNELRYLRRVDEEIDAIWRARQPDLDRLRRVAAMLYTSHGLVWKSQGCNGSGEHDPYASEIVDRCLMVERSAGPHRRAIDAFMDWRCEPCGWNHRTVYTYWALKAKAGDAFDPEVTLSVLACCESGADGVETPASRAAFLRDNAAQVRLESNRLIAERLRDWTAQGLLSADVDERYRAEISAPCTDRDT